MAHHQEKQPYMEDADEEGNVIDDTKTYVSTGPPSVKEEANVSRTRKDNHRLKAAGSGSSSPMGSPLHLDSDSNSNNNNNHHSSSPRKRDARRARESRDKEREREKAREKEKRTSKDRPKPRTSRTALPVLQTTTTSSSSRKQQGEQPRGSPTKHVPSPIITAAATSGRPRAYTSTNQRPSSYYGPSASKPPLANARYYANAPPPLGTSFPPQSPFVPIPPPSPGPYLHAPSPFAPLPPQAPDYFNHAPRPLHRPDYRRPSSALGRPSYQPSPGIGYPLDYDDDPEEGGVLLRRPSLKTRPTRQELDDRARMPPPGGRRPSTTIQTRSPFFPPPLPIEKRQSFGSIASADYDEESILDDESFYSPSEQGLHYNYRPHPVRRPSIDPSLHEQAVTSEARRGRRSSLHLGGRTQSAERDLEDKMRLARSYQDKVDGPVNPLTTDSLRQISKITGQGGGARSATRSRGDSGYAPTNRNSIDMMDDMRILVKGTATLTIGDAQMDVKDGAEIRIPTSVGGDRNSRGGSDQGSSYADERERERDRDSRRPEEGGRRTRHERERLGGGGGGGTTTATQHARDRRATSRAGSHSRGYGHGHGQAIPASPYPLEYGGGSLGSHYYHSQPPLAYAPYGSHGFPYPS